MANPTKEHRVLILGAGYSGMMCAIRTAGRVRRRAVSVTLVNPSPRFTERLRLHQVATGQRLTDFQIPDLLRGTGVEFRQGVVENIDAEAREVLVASPDGERTLEYDTLVYALGGLADPAGVPGVHEHAHTLNGPASAAELAARLAAAQGAVVVCGSGLTGVETAAEVAESRPDLPVVLLGRGVPGAMMGERARAYLDGALDRLRVRVQSGTEITKVLPDAIELSDGSLVPSEVTIWTAGTRVPPLAAEAGLTVDDRGRIVVDEALRSVSHPEVFAIGDAAAARQRYGEIHGTCQSGMPTAAHAADGIARVLRGREPRPFRFGYIHQPVSLGRRDAVVQFTHPDDTPRRWYLKGRWAVRYKEFVSASPTKSYRLSRRLPGAFLWPHGGHRTR